MRTTSAIAIALCTMMRAVHAVEPVVAEATDENGVRVHRVRSDFQAGETQIRVLLPCDRPHARRFPTVYVLPVEAGGEDRYGDGLAELKSHAIADKHAAVFVAPTFSHLPWYTDHPTDQAIRQESYFLDVVVPFVEQTYPVTAGRDGRFLLGFSKSGWGAWTLLLRHPSQFARAVAWDAPLMMDRAGPYGSRPIFGSEENFAGYQVSTLLRARAAELGDDPRLILLGYGSFRDDHQRTHALLDELKIAHVYRDGPMRAHHWHSGWVAEAIKVLLEHAARDGN
jgi:S-formylglutathione hydrolase FrmB